MTSAHAQLGLTYLRLGRMDEVIAEIEKERSDGYRNFALAIAYHALDRKRESDEALARLVQMGEDWGAQIASANAFRGESDQAFEWLERASARHDQGICSCRVAPLLEGLHSDSRWARFLERVGLSPLARPGEVPRTHSSP